VTEHDRWWLAYCLFGLGLIIRAPTFSTALGVLAVWAVVLAVLSIRALRDVLNNAVVTARTHLGKAPIKRTPTAKDQRWDEVRTGRPLSGYSPTAAPPEPVTRHDLPRVPADAPMRTVVRDPMESVVRVQLSGTLWTTEELLTEIQAAVARAKHRGDGESGGAPLPPG
jgi:hypothetical protein